MIDDITSHTAGTIIVVSFMIFTAFIIWCVTRPFKEPQCDHVEGGEIPYTTEGISVWLWFTYCPKCGEKL